MAEVDDREPPVGEADVPALVRPGPCPSGPAVGDQVVHHLERGRRGPAALPREADRPAYSAHGREAARATRIRGRAARPDFCVEVSISSTFRCVNVWVTPFSL